MRMAHDQHVLEDNKTAPGRTRYRHGTRMSIRSEDEGVDTTANALMLDGHVYPVREAVKELGFVWTRSIAGKDGFDYWLKVLPEDDDGEETTAKVKAVFEGFGWIVTTHVADCNDWVDE